MLTVINSREWQLKRKQREGPVKTIYGTKARIRQIVLGKYKHTCRKCGKKNVKLDVHHIIPRRDGGHDSMDNLEAVCTGCHKKVEPKRETTTVLLTVGTYSRVRNLIGDVENDEMMMIRVCRELEKRR